MMDLVQWETKGWGKVYGCGFFLYDILEKFIPICILQKENARAERYEKIKQELKKTLNTAGWDGRWFKRAFTDDSQILRKYWKRRM